LSHRRHRLHGDRGQRHPVGGGRRGRPFVTAAEQHDGADGEQRDHAADRAQDETDRNAFLGRRLSMAARRFRVRRMDHPLLLNLLGETAVDFDCGHVFRLFR